jgi:hypothetical protein
MQKRWTTPEAIDRELQYHSPSDKARPVHEEVREMVRAVAHRFNDLLPESPARPRPSVTCVPRCGRPTVPWPATGTTPSGTRRHRPAAPRERRPAAGR